MENGALHHSWRVCPGTAPISRVGGGAWQKRALLKGVVELGLKGVRGTGEGQLRGVSEGVYPDMG